MNTRKQDLYFEFSAHIGAYIEVYITVTAKLISAFVFATQIVCTISLFPKSEISSL